MTTLRRLGLAVVAVAVSAWVSGSPNLVTDVPAAVTTMAAGTRDPAVWPFARTSPWNYPIGSRAEYAVITSDLTHDGIHYLRVQADQYTSSTWVGAPADPINVITRDDRPKGHNVFPQRVPPAATASPGSDASITLVREDHLAAMDLGAPTRMRKATGTVWVSPTSI